VSYALVGSAETWLSGFWFSPRERARGKRQYINDIKTRDLMRRIDAYFRTIVKVPRVRMGERQEIETLINEEALLLARYLRDEKPSWHPRIVALS
jgi:hypothetical protein